ncbi:hypothetical protein ACFWU5_16875 [Nocardia sp. NPDC058640]|uniref:hypothetical protein n=1 Tax=Nocardia sp. NPDC058640 TaxID=3346571 RepID=UPI00365C727C
MTDSPTHNSEAWLEYVHSLMKLHKLNSAEFASLIGSQKGMLTHWRRGVMPSVEKLRDIATVFHRPFAEVLVAAGYAEPDEVGLTNGVTITKLSDMQLLRLVQGRLEQLAKEPGQSLRRDLIIGDVEESGDEVGALRTAQRTKAEPTVSTTRNRAQGRVGKNK